MNKKEIRDLIKEMQGVNLLTVDEAANYLEITADSEEGEALDLIENTLVEVAIERGTAEDDIQKLARMLTFTTHREGVTEKELFTLFEKPEMLDIIAVEVYEILGSRRAQKKNEEPSKLYHFILTVEYKGNEYSFGYNKVNGGLSYSINGGPITWFNLPKKFIDKPLGQIKDLLIDIMDIDVFE